MTASTDDLIEMFDDGKRPSGSAFKMLIVSMTPKSDFDKHTAEFRHWVETGNVHMGSSGEGWTVVTKGPDTISFVPDTPEATTPESSHLDLYGWTTSFGRTGSGKDPDRFGKSGLLDGNTLGQEPCGKWVTLLNPPAGLSASELVIATEQVGGTKSGLIMRVIRALIGLETYQPDICHAIATTRARGLTPDVKRTNPSRTSRLLFRSLWQGPLLMLVQAGLVFASNAAKTGLPAGLIAIAILIFLGLRRAMQLTTVRSHEIRLRWKANGKSDTDGNKVHRLQVRGPKPANNPDARLHYHITALWG